jgi:hypothetical protein
MGVLLQRWQQGFALGDQFYTKVFDHKIFWAVSTVSVAAGLIRELIIIKYFYYSYCPACFIINALLFSIIYYLISVTLFFYGDALLENQEVNLTMCFKRSLVVAKTLPFWFMVVVVLPGGIASFFSAFVIPTLIVHAESKEESLSFLLSAVKRFWMEALGLTVYVAIMFLFVGGFIGIAAWFLIISHVPQLVSAGRSIDAGGILLITGFISAMWTFFQVHIYKSIRG